MAGVSQGLKPTNVVLNQAFLFKPVGSHAAKSTIATAFTLTPPAGADKLMIQNDGTVDVRYTIDGTEPTAATGFVLVANDPPIIIPIDQGPSIALIQEAEKANIQYVWGGTHRG